MSTDVTADQLFTQALKNFAAKIHVHEAFDHIQPFINAHFHSIESAPMVRAIIEQLGFPELDALHELIAMRFVEPQSVKNLRTPADLEGSIGLTFSMPANIPTPELRCMLQHYSLINSRLEALAPHK